MRVVVVVMIMTVILLMTMRVPTRCHAVLVMLVRHQTRMKSSPTDVVDPASTLVVSSSRSTAAR